jgi:hypothetical protein
MRDMMELVNIALEPRGKATAAAAAATVTRPKKG